MFGIGVTLPLPPGALSHQRKIVLLMFRVKQGYEYNRRKETSAIQLQVNTLFGS